ncbi:hypothetical protein Tco_0257801 [Tanacetum coccineum]
MKVQHVSADASTDSPITQGHIADSIGKEDQADPEEDLSDCPERKNRNHENQTRGAGARGAVHALREGETDQDPNNIKDEIKAYIRECCLDSS